MNPEFLETLPLTNPSARNRIDRKLLVQVICTLLFVGIVTITVSVLSFIIPEENVNENIVCQYGNIFIKMPLYFKVYGIGSLIFIVMFIFCVISSLFHPIVFTRAIHYVFIVFIIYIVIWGCVGLGVYNNYGKVQKTDCEREFNVFKGMFFILTVCCFVQIFGYLSIYSLYKKR